MTKKEVIVTGAKETFIIRVLAKKIEDAGFDYVFTPLSINNLADKLTGKQLLILYMGEGELPDDAVMYFMKDKMRNEGSHLIIIGENDEDISFVIDRIPGELIYKYYRRPIDNDEFVKTVKSLFEKVESGDFKKSILIVDDDANYLNLVREWLKDTYKVSMASSGLQAIKWLGKNRVDLILLDHEMPVTSGPQVLEMLRSDPETSSIPVMFLTGKSDKKSVMSVVSLKPEGYFLKTIQKEELLKNLEGFFNQRVI